MRRQLLHPGTILGVIALIVALSGSVYAASNAGGITSAQIRNGTIKLKDISPQARTALRGATGATGATGAAGAPGAAGSARAFGFVSSAGVVDAARSKNITATKIAGFGAGAYCVTPTASAGVTRATAFPLVSADVTDGIGSLHVAQIISFDDPTNCPGGWRVVTDNFSAGAFNHTDIAFTILIP
jgi:hypothetical protein